MGESPFPLCEKVPLKDDKIERQYLMTYTWNMRLMGDVFVLPGDIVDNHLRLAGSTQLKVLLWCARCGRGEFDAQACSAAIGVSPADFVDALQ